MAGASLFPPGQEVEQSNMEHLHPQVYVLTSGRIEFFIQAACRYLQTHFKLEVLLSCAIKPASVKNGLQF